MEVIHSKVYGISHKNKDGSERQTSASNCYKGELLDLNIEWNEEYQEKALKVFTSKGKQTGFKRHEFAQDLLGYLEDGYLFEVYVSEVTGGSKDKPTLGININIHLYEQNELIIPEKETKRQFKVKM